MNFESNTLPWEENDVEVIEDITTTECYDLVVYNDDINTFDHVIETLIDICGHEPEQAEQCTLIIHYKGKCAVKKGSFDELAPMRNAICDRGISAEVM
ncbi:MAG: ATP-dependent Clp protease adaptor ClpS [Spirosomataceae bacterium]